MLSFRTFLRFNRRKISSRLQFSYREEPLRAAGWLRFLFWSCAHQSRQYNALLFVVYNRVGLFVYWFIVQNNLLSIACHSKGCDLLLPFIFYAIWPEEEEGKQEAAISLASARRLARTRQISGTNRAKFCPAD